MNLKIKGISIEFSFYFVAVISLMLIISPNFNSLYLFLFCSFHEIGHIISMVLLGKRPYKIELGYYGIKIIPCNISSSIFADIIILFSGPLINIIFSIIFKLLKYNDIFIINLSLMIFNLLPIQSLDGGRIVSLLIGENNSKVISKVCNVIIIIIGIVVAIYSKSNHSILLVGLYLLIGNKTTNII